MSEISIIIVSWNAQSYLRNCLASIKQTAAEASKEVIVIDNNSSDGSPAMVQTEFPEVRLISLNENVGFARANNIGIQSSCGEYLALVNSDVLVHPGCLQKLKKFMEERSDVGLTGPRITGGDGHLQLSCRKFPTLWNTFCEALLLTRLFAGWPLFAGREMADWNHDTLAEVEVLSGCFWMARSSAVKQIGSLDERFFFYAEDVDWCKRFKDGGWKVMLYPEATAVHFGGGSSSNAPLRYSIELHRANLAYWRKHRNFSGMVCYYVLTILHHSLRVALRAGGYILGRKQKVLYKLKRSWVCLRWLLFRMPT